MKPNIIILALAQFIFCSCQSKEIKHTESKSYDFTTIQRESNMLFDSLTIIDDNFIMRVKTNDLLSSSILNHYSSINKQTQIKSNVHYPSQIDTLITFNKINDNFEFLKTPQKELLLSANIESSALNIDNNIAIGCNSTIVYQKFNLSQAPKILSIENTEGGNKITFYFNSNILVKIKFELFMLD